MELLKKEYIRIVLFFLLLFCISLKINSQEQILNQFYDQNTEQKHFRIVYKDTVIFNALGLSIVIDANRLFPERKLTPECPLTKPLLPPLRVAEHKLFADVHNKNAIQRNIYNHLIKNNLNQIKYTSATFTDKMEPAEKIRTNLIQFLFTIDENIDFENVAKPERLNAKRRYWTYNGNHKIQLSQNYLSNNWYKGGVKNFNLLNRHDISFNYTKKKFQFNNFAEWKLYLFTNPNDTLRYGSIGEDLIRTYSNFGLQAFKNWYYSSNIEIKTELFKNYKENSIQPITALFSPIYINIGFLGMRYQIEKSFPKVRGKKINFNADISPLSVKYIAVLNKDIDPKRFGIEEGSRHLTHLGSTINTRLVYFFNKYVNFSSRFYYFTNYETITAESENTLNMPINRYFSTSLYLFIRYDDNKNIKSDQTFGFFQINEMISFGFNYSW